MKITFGDHVLAIDLPEGLDYGFQDNGALMAYNPDNDSFNLFVSTVTATPKDPTQTDAAFERVIRDAQSEKREYEVVGGNKSVYHYTKIDSWEEYQQHLHEWIIGYGIREIIITASCLIDHPDFPKAKPYLDRIPEMIESIRVE